jgi:hypothetical protein
MFYDFRCSFIYEQKGLKNSAVNAKNAMTAVSKKIKIKDYFSGLFCVAISTIITLLFRRLLFQSNSISYAAHCALSFCSESEKGSDDQERSKHNRPGYIPTRCKSLCYLTQYFDVLLPQNCTLNYKNGFCRSFQN